MQINGLVLGKYRIEKLINNGSFASVFRAREELTSRIVAIKALPKSIYPPGRLRYLLTELSAMILNWGHENIVSIHTVEPGGEEYVAYIVMEYIDGPTLYERMATESFSSSRAINIGLDICRGLIAVHERNIIHRDIKPQNILLTPKYTAKISDFGVARILEATNDFAETLTGTRKYMAPEQYDGEYDCRVDLYSLGLILYEMLAGRFPFRGKNHNEIKMKKLDMEIDFTHELPNEFCEFLQKVLHRDVNSRYQTAAEMYNDLDRIRETWYEKAVRKMLRIYSDPNVLHTKLARDREELTLSAESAQKIELEIQYEKLVEDERQRQYRLEQKTDTHYERAIQQIHSTNPQCALQEIQQAHCLYLTKVERTKKVEWIFRSVSESLTIPETPSTANAVIDLIKQLPSSEVRALEAWFDEQLLPSTIDEPAAALVPDQHETENESLVPQLESQITPPEEATSEFVLRTLHEDTKYPHEMKAAQICHSAEQYARERNKRARSEYKKLAEFYRQSAMDFIASEDWELAADCYARARLAYVAARRPGSARQIADEAGIYYTKLAEDIKKQQRWAEAGRQYIISAEHYTHGESLEVADERRLRATVCYLNAAESARMIGDVEHVYEYCQKIFAIREHMRMPSKAVAAARKLIEEIEGLFSDQPQVQHQFDEHHPRNSVTMRRTMT